MISTDELAIEVKGLVKRFGDLTALNDSLRAIMLEGSGLLVLGAWTVVPLVLALRWFRWV